MRKRRLVGVFASLMLSASVLAGCGGGNNDTAGSGDKEKADSGTKTAEVIKLGLNLELSGGVASYGASAANGVELAIDEINKAGGADGKQLELVKMDNKSDAAEATSVALKLANEEKVMAIIGPATSTATLGEVQISNDSKTLVVTPTGTNQDITFKDGKVNEFMFRTCFIDPFQGIVAANFASNDLKVKNAAIFTDSSSDYAKGLGTAFKGEFTKSGGATVSEESYVAKDTDFKATLTRIKSKNPDVVFVPGYYEEVGLILKQARELGLNVPFVGGDGWDSPKLLELAGATALNNTFMVNHYSSEDPDPKIQEFTKAYKAKYNEVPAGFAALGYDTVYLLKDAVERAKSTDSIKVKDAFATIKDLPLVTGNFTIDEHHDPIKSAVILEFKEGKQTFKTKVNP